MQFVKSSGVNHSLLPYSHSEPQLEIRTEIPAKSLALPGSILRGRLSHFLCAASCFCSKVEVNNRSQDQFPHLVLLLALDDIGYLVLFLGVD